MNRSSAPLVLTFLALSACTHQPPLPPSQTVLARPSSHDAPVYVGHYYFAFEVASFNPCGSQDSWWVVSADPSVTQQLRDFVTRHIAEFPRNQLNRVYVRWRGTPSAPGRFGHMGSYSRQFTVLEVLEVRFATPEDCNLQSTLAPSPCYLPVSFVVLLGSPPTALLAPRQLYKPRPSHHRFSTPPGQPALPPNHSLKQPAAAVACWVPVSSQVRRFAAAHCSPIRAYHGVAVPVARGGRCLAQSR